MAELFNPRRHESLHLLGWDAQAAQAAIERIVDDTRRIFTRQGLWPNHPNDELGNAAPAGMLYLGAAGVIWGLDHLVREGAARPGPTFADQLPSIRDQNHAALAGQGVQTRSLLIGDSGILYTQWKMAPSEDLLAPLAAMIADNTDDPAQELMWGAPGTMLIARALHDSTREPRWAELFRAGAAALDRTFQSSPELDACIWTQDLYGQRTQMLGAVHGFAGNAFALISGQALLDPDMWARLSPRLARTLAATAVRDGSAGNWPSVAGAGEDMLVQHCHGAPGMVTSLAALSEPIDELLIAGGELIWMAGPLSKGASLCHGTGGNGLAFLKLFVRTGDERWLDRARAFAMHAIRQSDTDAARFGRRRYSLWTGDIGLACYLWECIRGTDRFPTLDVL